jgi:glycosyltransferase involved in cell wall biosynthesis
MRVSGRRNRAARIFDMMSGTWRHRNQYTVAVVDVFSGQAFGWAEASCWLLRRLGRPYILALHGGNLPDFASMHPHRVRSLLSSAAAVTSPSDYLQRELSHYRSDIILLRNPIDLDRYAFRLRESVEPRLIWLRAFHEMYNPCLAVTTLAHLRRKHSRSSLLMVGPDKGDGSIDRVRAEAACVGVADAVTFVPGIPKCEVPLVMQRGDIFINTTDVDNTPVSVVEAMACGLCVVSTDVGGLKCLLTHERNALLVPPNNAEAMSKAVERLVDTPDLAHRLSASARELAEEYDWSVVRPCWEKLLTQVLADNRARRNAKC